MKRIPYPQLIIILGLTSLWLSACGRSEPAASGPTPTSLLAATPISTHVFAQPTTLIKQSAEATPTPDPAAADLARGERAYTSRGCADCHGTAGEGIEGQGSALAGTALTEEEFTDLLRTGGEGSLGNDHLYGPQAISPSGMKALYAYVKSFQ